MLFSSPVTKVLLEKFINIQFLSSDLSSKWFLVTPAIPVTMNASRMLSSNPETSFPSSAYF